MKIVIVTGCLGFMGAYFTRKALARGWRVRGIDKMTYAANPNLLQEFGKYPNFQFEKRDIKRSEEHTSELQSLVNLVCRLLLEKKNDVKREV